MTYHILANGIPFASAATEVEARTVAARAMLTAPWVQVRIEMRRGALRDGEKR